MLYLNKKLDITFGQVSVSVSVYGCLSCRYMGDRCGDTESKFEPGAAGSRQSQFGAQTWWLHIPQQWGEKSPACQQSATGGRYSGQFCPLYVCLHELPMGALWNIATVNTVSVSVFRDWPMTMWNWTCIWMEKTCIVQPQEFEGQYSL